MVMDSDEALVDQIAADKSFTAEDIDEMDLSSGLDEKGNKNNHPYSNILDVLLHKVRTGRVSTCCTG